MAKLNRRPTAPGRILAEHYLKPRELSVTQFADTVGVTRKHISNIVHGKATITPATAVRFAKVLDTTPEFWLNLQNAVDLHDEQKKLANWEPKEVYPADYVTA